MNTLSKEASAGRRDFCLNGLRCAVGGSAAVFTATIAATAKTPTRESIESIDAGKLEKIEAAIGEMMDRSKKNPKDPKGWLVNAEPHKEFCAAPGAGGASQIHFCYWFLPWHRAYLTVTERKIREIASDASLSFPYWNWSSSPRLPKRFTRPGSPLANAIRYSPSRDLRPSEIDYFEDDPVLKKFGVAALSASKFVAAADGDPVKRARELADSFGGLIRPNDQNRYGNSRLEGTPHGPVHVYVGGADPTGSKVGDMTDFATAARDPLFFAHHGNLDRLWEIWRTTGKNRSKEPTTSDFLDHTFVFPWLDGTPMQISVAETMDTVRLGYAYDNLNVFSPAPLQPDFTPEASGQTKQLAPIVNVNISLPSTPESAAEGTSRYVLVLEGVASPGRAMTAGVYVSSADSANPRRVLVGSISIVRSGGEYKTPNDTLVFEITAAISVLQTRKLKVFVIPNEIGGESKSPYRSLKYKKMHIVRE